MKSARNIKTAKIVVDILISVFLVLSFFRWEGNPSFHFTVGIACALFFAIHVCIHRKWMLSVTKSCLAGKLNKSLKARFIIDILLSIIWSVSIVTGFLAIGSYVNGIESMAVFGRVHGLTARLGLVLVLIHIFQHRKQIKSYFRIRQGKQAAK